MSYILEALKKSESDRELSQVPRVQGFGIDVPIEPPRRRPWSYLTILLALLTLGAGGFALVQALGPARLETTQQRWTRAAPAPEGLPAQPSTELRLPPAAPNAGFADPAASPEPTPELAASGAPSRVVGPIEDVAAPPMPEPATPLPARSRYEAGAPPSAAGGVTQAPAPQQRTPDAGAEPRRQETAATPTKSTDALPLEDPEDLSIEPKVLVVPAPAKPGEPLPRGAEELRRAVLGGGDQLSASVEGASQLPAPPPPEAPLPSEPSPSEQTPVPDDLIAEIEAFKDLVRKQDPSVAKRAAAAPPPLPEPPGLSPRPAPERVPVPPSPSLELRNRLPPFSMSVHVYNPDPQRRFVYINGRKLTESQESREGLRLERIVADGAVLSFEGERFFQRR